MKNKLDLEVKDYQGGKSTLCTGCGHDNVTQAIISGYHKSSVHPFKVAKLSGIGCSSKTPAYFLKQSHGFNSIHGRMAAVATGAKLANRNLQIIGVSGDGDTASIGIGGFIHLIRRNVPMVYIVENNGVYGLTKGQFSATADLNSKQKNGEINPFKELDICALAIEAGCEFVARSFSGDAKQLVPLIQAAIQHPGTAVIDVISPCITYANHAGSTKSYDYVKEHKVALQDLGFISEREHAAADYNEGDITQIEMADGSFLTLKKLLSESHNLTDAAGALQLLHSHRNNGEILTGLFYRNSLKKPLEQVLGLPTMPLAHMNHTELSIDKNKFQALMDAFK
ncbi:MAG: hypothetical protein KDD38_09850 [Bdellovibrionales bacterium]|nr:hypothetical protein [Bdellovibrionales bacterium]